MTFLFIIRLMCYLTLSIMLFLGVIFDEDDIIYWDIVLMVSSFIIGIEIGVFIFS